MEVGEESSSPMNIHPDKTSICTILASICLESDHCVRIMAQAFGSQSRPDFLVA